MILLFELVRQYFLTMSAKVSYAMLDTILFSQLQSCMIKCHSTVQRLNRRWPFPLRYAITKVYASSLELVDITLDLDIHTFVEKTYCG